MLMEAPAFVAELEKFALSFGDNVSFKKEINRLCNDKTFPKALSEWEKITQAGKFAQGEALSNFNLLIDCYSPVYNKADFSERMLRAILTIDSCFNDYYTPAENLRSSLSRFHRFISAAMLDKRRTDNAYPVSIFTEASTLKDRVSALEGTVKTLTEQNAALQQQVSQLQANTQASIPDAVQPVRRSQRNR